MNKLILMVLLLSSCSKNIPIEKSNDVKTVYYRLEDVNKDGLSYFSPVRVVNINSAVSDDNHPNCPNHPLPIILSSFTVTKQKDNTINLSWTAVDEYTTNYYNVQKSLDSKEWTIIGKVIPNTTGTYKFIDKN